MKAELPPFDRECFFITPIGGEDSSTRERADAILASILDPAASAAGLEVVRADHISEGGQINLQVIQHILGAETAVADLTGANPNVYYEVGMRHASRKHLALIADESAQPLPSDLVSQRAVFFTDALKGAAKCRDALILSLKKGKDGVVDSPVEAAVNLQPLQQGERSERAIAELVTKVDNLGALLARLSSAQEPIHRTAVVDLVAAWQRLQALARERSDDELAALVGLLWEPVHYVASRYRVRFDEEQSHSSAPGASPPYGLRRGAEDVLGTTDAAVSGGGRSNAQGAPPPPRPDGESERDPA